MAPQSRRGWKSHLALPFRGPTGGVATEQSGKILDRAAFCERYIVQSVSDQDGLTFPQDTQVFTKAQDALSAARNGFEFYKNLQSDDGHWSGEYSGPHFLTPGLVIGSYVTGMDFALQEKLEMIRYLMNTANDDGGWGM